MALAVARFAGKTVLVTAAAAGAGRVIAEAFAEEGASVFACDVDGAAVAAFAAARPDIAVRLADVSDEAAVGALFAEIAEAGQGGSASPGNDRGAAGVDILVNNAGIAGPTAAPEDVTLAEWERTMAVNVTGQFLCARAAIPAMKAKGQGAIINISSASATVGLPMRLPYVVSKVAVLGLTRNLARELGPFGIRVNAILPGPIEGDRMRRVIAAKAIALGQSEAEYEADLTRFISMKSFVAPQDVAAMALFLASDGGRLVSGQLIGVDGNIEYEA